MVISSNLSLLPYAQDNYTLQPVNRQMMLPGPESAPHSPATGRHGPATGRHGPEPGHQAMNRYDLYRRETMRYHYIYTDAQNLTYSPNRRMESYKVDHLGSRVDIYI